MRNLSAILLLMLLLVFLLSHSKTALCQQQGGCSEEFDIDKVDFQVTNLNENISLLENYVLCRAIVKKDPDQCNYLSNNLSRFEECKKNYKFSLFLNEALSSKTTILENMSACKDSYCKVLAQSIINKDLAGCKTIHEKDGKDLCSAIINDDLSSCNKRTKCVDTIYYMRALKENDASMCSSINDKFRQTMCRAHIVKDISICCDDSYDNFVNIYCSYQ